MKCFPDKNDDEIREYLLKTVKNLSVDEEKLNFDAYVFNVIQRKSIIALLIGIAGVDEFDGEDKEVDLLNEVCRFFEINESEMALCTRF